ncbi:MAG: AAA family ATPase [Chlorobi bacterium]|nr:AAA family ATPase [Chlorobiota bacterium]
MLITRLLSDVVSGKLQTTNKAVILYGARQLGKTTLSKLIIDKLGYRALSINADQEKYIEVLPSRDLNKLQSLVHGYELLFIDEAQRVPNIGNKLKTITDEIPDLKLLVTGSSSLNRADKIQQR